MLKLFVLVTSIAMMAVALVGSMIAITKIDVWTSADYLLVGFTALLLAVVARLMDTQDETDARKLTK